MKRYGLRIQRNDSQGSVNSGIRGVHIERYFWRCRIL